MATQGVQGGTEGGTPTPKSSGSRKRKESANRSPLWEYFTRCKFEGSDEIDPTWCTCDTCKERVLCDKTRNKTNSM